jgi:hypothetical protein
MTTKTLKDYASLPTTSNGQLKGKLWTTSLNTAIDQGLYIDLSTLPDTIEATLPDKTVVHPQTGALIALAFERCFAAASAGNAISLKDSLKLAEAGYLIPLQATVARAMALASSSYSEPLAGHYLSADQLDKQSIMEYLDIVEIVLALRSIKESDTKADILRVIHKLIALPASRQDAIDELRRKEKVVSEAKEELELYLDDIKILSDSQLSGMIKLDLPLDAMHDLQAMIKPDSKYPMQAMQSIPPRRDGILILSPERIALTLSVK